MHYCRNCGTIVDNDSRFCPECGAPQVIFPEEKASANDSAQQKAASPSAVFADGLECGYLLTNTELLAQALCCTHEGTEKGIYFYILENRLFEEFFKFLQVCSNFRFSRGYYQKNGAYCPYFPFLLSSIRFILTRFDANIATALCIVNALRP